MKNKLLIVLALMAMFATMGMEGRAMTNMKMGQMRNMAAQEMGNMVNMESMDNMS